MVSKKVALFIVFGCALLGIAIATYSFAHNRSIVSGSFCTLSSTFNCDIVNRGPYSVLFGVPVALIGFLGYGLLAVTALWKLYRPEDRGLTAMLVFLALGGFGFSLYLTGLEAFVLEAWCLLCLTSQTLILIILGFTGSLWYTERNHHST